MSEQELTGLDGNNPLSFLAALGVLNALSENVSSDLRSPKLVWRPRGSFVPALIDGPERENLLNLLVEDLETFREEPAIKGLRYAKGKSQAHDLKPPPVFFTEYLKRLVASGSLRSLDFAAAFATDVATDNNGNTKPTAFHFTAGQQEFLRMVSELIHGRDRIQGVSREDLSEAIFGPWKYERPLPILSWDNTTARDYALRASNPSNEKKLGVPGADWLAFRGLPYFRTVPIKNRIATTGFKGEWKTSTFRWPLWNVPIGRDVIRSLVTSPELYKLDPTTLRARGIEVVFEAGVRRTDQGGYGSFTPARIAKPTANISRRPK